MQKDKGQEDARRINVAYSKLNEFMYAARHNLHEDNVESDALRALLGKMLESLREIDETVGLSGDVAPKESILFALNPETSAWADVNVPQGEVPLWKAFGFSPREAREWRDENLGVLDAARWLRGEIPRYMGARITPAVIKGWEANQFSPVSAIWWIREGIEADVAAEWRDLGGTVDDAKTWLVAFAGEDLPTLFELSRSSLKVDLVKKYRDQGVPLEQIILFSKKGYPPHSAKKMLERGKDAASAPDKSNGAPIPGKAWAKIEKAAKDSGWTVTSIERVARGTHSKTYETKVTFDKKGTDGACAYFSGARFLRGANKRFYWSDVRSISGFIEKFLK